MASTPPEELLNEFYGEKGWVDKRNPTHEAARRDDDSTSDWEDREKDYAELECGCIAGIDCTCK